MRWLMAIARSLERETFAQVDAANVLVEDDLRRRALAQDLAAMENVGAGDDVERLADIVVGDQDPDAAVLEMRYEIADFADGDRVDAGHRLPAKGEVGKCGRGPGDLHPPPAPPR